MTTTACAPPGTVLLSDPRIARVPVLDAGEPLVALDVRFGPARARVRAGLAARLEQARRALPDATRLHVLEGHRPVWRQREIITAYDAQVRATHPDADPAERHHLVSRYVAPIEVAPHVAGAAVDLTLVDRDDRPLDLGCPVDATPEESQGRCFTAAPVPPAARSMRDLLCRTLSDAGLVNYPTEWWHWSFGDRYWAWTTGADAAPYGPVDVDAGRAV